MTNQHNTLVKRQYIGKTTTYWNENDKILIKRTVKVNKSSVNSQLLLHCSFYKNTKPQNFHFRGSKSKFQLPQNPKMSSVQTLTHLFFFFIVLFSSVTFNVLSHSDNDRVSELLDLQSRSKSGVIHLDDHSVSRFLTSLKTPRPYSLLIFFDAAQLHEKQELHLKDLYKEFSIVASSFITNNQDPSSPSHAKIFFCDIEFKEAQTSFSLFGVNALPHIRLIGPNHGLKDSDQMDQGDFSRLAESMAEFIESRTKLVVGPIHRPPLLSKKQMVFAVVAWLIWLPFIVKKVISGKTLLHDPKIWLSGAVFIYFFSVSGAMHNIIRKMPMFLADRNDPSQLIFFYQGSGM